MDLINGWKLKLAALVWMLVTNGMNQHKCMETLPQLLYFVLPGLSAPQNTTPSNGKTELVIDFFSSLFFLFQTLFFPLVLPPVLLLIHLFSSSLTPPPLSPRCLRSAHIRAACSRAVAPPGRPAHIPGFKVEWRFDPRSTKSRLQIKCRLKWQLERCLHYVFCIYPQSPGCTK